VTAQGSARTRFQRAVDGRQLVMAEMALRELQWVSLKEALELVVLYAHEDSPKFEQAAVRWLARYALEGRDVRLMDAQLAAAWMPARAQTREGGEDCCTRCFDAPAPARYTHR
jgi:hypothetical protein